jgi:hypothetical protein
VSKGCLFDFFARHTEIGGSLSAQQSLLAYAFAEKARQALKEFIERKQPLKR